MNPPEWLDWLTWLDAVAGSDWLNVLDAGSDWLDVIDPEYPSTALIPGPDAWTYTAGMPEALPAHHNGWWAHG